MITQEQFDAVVAKIAAGENLTAEEGTELVQTIAEFEQRSMFIQQVVEFALQATEEVCNGVIDKVLRNLNLRDLDKVKQIRSISSKTSENLVGVVQLYIAQMYTQAQSTVVDADPNILDSKETA